MESIKVFYSKLRAALKRNFFAEMRELILNGPCEIYESLGYKQRPSYPFKCNVGLSEYDADKHLDLSFILDYGVIIIHSLQLSQACVIRNYNLFRLLVRI